MMKLLLVFFAVFSAAIYSQTWQIAGTMPMPVSGGQAVVYGSKIYILGGFSEELNSNVNLIQVYDPQTNTWSDTTVMKAQRSDFVAGIFSNNLYYAGGVSGNSPFASAVEVWDFKSSPQVFNSDDYFNRQYPTGQLVNDNLYIFGGSVNSIKSPYMFEYNLTKSKVTYSDNSPFPAFYPSQQMSAVLGNYIFIFGGARGVLINTILKFKISSKEFETMSVELSKPRAGGVAVPYMNNSILIIGGFDETHQALSSVDSFYAGSEDGSVSPGPSLNFARVDPEAVNYYGDIYVFGGLDREGQPVPQIEILKSGTTGISTEVPAPQTFELENNYPNPFNPSTKITFKIARSTEVSLDIYSVLGKHIKNLTSKFYNSGTYDLTWNGTDDSGNQVPSGVYIYRLTSAYFSASKKMILLK